MSSRWGLICLLALPAWSQSVISVYSGVINYAEGTVLLDDRPLEPKPGRFEEIKPGSQLRLEEGRAEVLLTPGVFLRLGPGSAIHMVSNLLVDTKVDLIHGPAVIDAAEPTPETSVTVMLRNYEVHIKKAGRYRFDSIPPELRVSDGEAEVSLNGDKPTTVESGQLLHLLSGVLVPSYALSDELDSWDKDRSEAIARGNAEISQTPEISSLVDAAQNNPLLTDPALLAPGLGGYSSTAGLGLPGAGTVPYGYGSPGYGSLGMSPYSLYPYPLYSSSPYPYSVYPYGLLGVPGTVIVPLYRYGIGTRPLSLGNALGTLGLGYRGYSYSGGTLLHTPGTPVFHPGAPVGIRGTPSVAPVRPPVRVGGRR